MPTTISLSEVETHFSKIINRIYQNGEPLIVERSGSPVVVIIPAWHVSRYEQMLAIWEQVVGRLQEHVYPDWSEDEWLRAAASNPVFADLGDPEEDIYSLDDGRPFAVSVRRSKFDRLHARMNW